MWHHIIFWVTANFVGVTLEALGDQLSNAPQLQQFEVNFDCCSRIFVAGNVSYYATIKQSCSLFFCVPFSTADVVHFRAGQ